MENNKQLSPDFTEFIHNINTFCKIEGIPFIPQTSGLIGNFATLLRMHCTVNDFFGGESLESLIDELRSNFIASHFPNVDKEIKELKPADLNMCNSLYSLIELIKFLSTISQQSAELEENFTTTKEVLA